jgi:hypothetical protein
MGAMTDDDRLVLLAVADNELEANVWRDILSADGISAYAKSTDPMSSFGAAPAPGTIELHVKASQAKKARWLLGDRIDGGGPD